MTDDIRARLTAGLADRYRIERELGAGGMATVYLAHDLKHDRDVAIKVLHPDLGAALGGDRFLSEIRTTAKLQHPHILPLLDSGEASGLLFYVMPVVTGETLRARLTRERQLPIADAVRLAREVASALDYAHRQGVVHRDIKPENILLHDGSALVADFGIALAVQSAGGQRMTQTGLSLGTPQYMSPEQAMGEKTIDARSDVYALGAVTYEMLCGDPPFSGNSVQAIVARVLTEKPTALLTLRDTVPAGVEAAVMTALAKLPADRFESARAFADALANPTHGGFDAVRATGAVRPSRAARVNRVVSWVAAAVSIAAAGWYTLRPTPVGQAMPLVLELPGGNPDLLHPAATRDGSRFAFGTDAGIEVREAGQREYRVIPGSANGEAPAFSWDGEWVSFNIRGHIMKASVHGGSAVPAIGGDSILAGNVDWGPKGELVFEARGGLYYLPAGGEVPKPLHHVVAAGAPHFTPDGKGILYFSAQTGGRLMYHDIARDTGWTVLPDAAGAQLLENGWLVYSMAGGGLFAAKFNAAKHATIGNPIPVATDFTPTAGASPFFVTTDGTLIYRSGVEPTTRLLVRTPAGRVDTMPVPPQRYGYVRYSPDGKKIAMTIGAARTVARFTSIYDITLGSMSRFTADGGGHAPVWSPDGTRLAYTAEGSDSDAEDVFVQPIDKSKPPVRVLKLPNDQHSSSWPVDTMLFVSSQSAPLGLGSRAIAVSRREVPNVVFANPSAPGTMHPYLQADWLEARVAVSPDLKWAAYESGESGPLEIMVRPLFGTGTGQWRVSSGGGSSPLWSGDGKTIYYQSLDGKAIKSVKVTLGASVTASAPTTVIAVPGLSRAWDVDRKSGNLLVSQAVAEDVVKMVVIQNWLPNFMRSHK